MVQAVSYALLQAAGPTSQELVHRRAGTDKVREVHEPWVTVHRPTVRQRTTGASTPMAIGYEVILDEHLVNQSNRSTERDLLKVNF